MTRKGHSDIGPEVRKEKGADHTADARLHADAYRDVTPTGDAGVATPAGRNLLDFVSADLASFPTELAQRISGLVGRLRNLKNDPVLGSFENVCDSLRNPHRPEAEDCSVRYRDTHLT